MLLSMRIDESALIVLCLTICKNLKKNELHESMLDSSKCTRNYLFIESVICKEEKGLLAAAEIYLN